MSLHTLPYSHPDAAAKFTSTFLGAFAQISLFQPCLLDGPGDSICPAYCRLWIAPEVSLLTNLTLKPAWPLVWPRISRRRTSLFNTIKAMEPLDGTFKTWFCTLCPASDGFGSDLQDACKPAL